MSYTLRTTVDLSQVKDLKREEPLLVAAVRGGRVLASREIDLQKARTVDRIPVELGFALAPGEDAAGVELRVGPAVPEAILPNFDGHVEKLDLRGKAAGVIELPPIKILDPIYIAWWRICHRYTITGRLVHRVVQGATVCYEAVPGATVELYDVDSLFFWHRKSLITTATTDVNGRFTATFRWCCWRGWFPPYLGWYIDHVQWDKLRGLLERLRHLVPQIPWPINPNPPDPPELMRLASTLDAAFGAAPGLDRAVVGPQPPLELAAAAPRLPAIAAPGLDLARAVKPLKLTGEAATAVADLRKLYPWWWWGNDCYPDLLFRATQLVGGVTTVVYDEPFSATRVDVRPLPSPHDVGNLIANEHAIAVSSCGVDTPPGDCFKFTDVGAIQVPTIGSVTAGGPLAGFAFAGSEDRPFGDSLEIFGAFGAVTKTVPASYVDYLKLQVAAWNGNPATLPPDAAFSDVPFARLGSVVRSYWGVVGTTEQWISYNFGPDTSGRYRTQESFQREFEAAHGGPPGPWGWVWTRAQWIATIDTRYLPDGLEVVRAIGYRDLGGGGFDQRVMLDCVQPGHPQVTELLPLHLDNTPLSDVVIQTVKVNGVLQSSVACQELKLKQGDVVTIGFRVDDARRHLYNFSLVEHHRLDCTVSLLNGSLAHLSPPPTAATSTYSGFIAAVGPAFRPEWEGGNYTVDLVVGAPPPAGAACNDCGYSRPYFPFSGAYDVRLDAWKRSTNGYGLLFHDESNLLFVVNRTDTPP